jgi:hypothetical protein
MYDLRCTMYDGFCVRERNGLELCFAQRRQRNRVNQYGVFDRIIRYLRQYTYLCHQRPISAICDFFQT